jgi:hypothetical protein
MRHLVYGQPPDVVVNRRHALDTPVLSMLRDAAVRFIRMLHGACDAGEG